MLECQQIAKWANFDQVFFFIILLKRSIGDAGFIFIRGKSRHMWLLNTALSVTKLFQVSVSFVD